MRRGAPQNKLMTSSTWNLYLTPATLAEALDLLAEYGDDARIIAGGTDLLLELARGVRSQRVLIDIARIPDLATVRLDNDGWLHLGPLVTHNQIVTSPLAVHHAFPLARACWEVGAPQIRNRGTVAGNVITASPANDTITPLWALDATMTLVSHRGPRTLTCAQFFQGVRRTALAPDEFLLDIAFPALTAQASGAFLKLGLRRAQAISLVNVAVVLHWDGNQVRQAAIALGAVAPTILRVTEAEQALVGSTLDAAAIQHAASLAAAASRPIDDVRASADYRRVMVEVLTRRALSVLHTRRERDGWPATPVTLGPDAAQNYAAAPTVSAGFTTASPVHFTLNGQPVSVHHATGKTLLDVLRAPAADGGVHLTGTKEGCAEGECGACTVLLNGAAVMSCLVPAPAAAGCTVTTVEGLAGRDGQTEAPHTLHAVQQAFVTAGAVQCGYCTPGLLMSATRLLAENPAPNRSAIEQALVGNLCRCTGYAKIVEAILSVSKQSQPS